jgi:MFS family permease
VSDTVRILFATKALRSFGDGMMSILLARYADLLGLSGFEAGAVATSALVGTAITTFLVGRYVERLGRRRVLIWGALLTAATGAAYAGSTALPLLIAVAFVGTVNPTSGDVSAFLPIEQAVLAQETGTRNRVTTFARFNVLGSIAGALGAGASAAAGLVALAPGVGDEGGVRWMFLAYSALGAATLLLVVRLGPGAEIAAGDGARPGLGPSRRRVGTLAGLFGVDAFAGGLVVQSLVALYLLREFDLDPSVTALVFLATSLLAAVSFLVSARLSMRFGMVNTMVFTHLPSNAFLLGVAFAPAAGVAIAFLALRALLSQMDVPPRQALVVSVVEPGERAAAAAYTGLARSLASMPAPSAGGAMLGAWGSAPFLACAALKSSYDLALFALFRHVERPPGP